MAHASHRPKHVLVAIGLLALAGASCLASGGLARPPEPAPLTVTVEGRRWWWEIRYPDADGSGGAVSANELHLPFGTPVRLVLGARDAIHGFWVPGLVDKISVVPGKPTETILRAEHPGVYRGQCAEFCGEGHARMTFVVVVEDEASYRAWLEAQRAPAAAPESEEARRGRDVFLAASCTYCHAVRGTPAAGAYGPDLTHVASRRTLRAGAIPRARGHVQEWLVRPVATGPGTPSIPASVGGPMDLHALIGYLETLR